MTIESVEKPNVVRVRQLQAAFWLTVPGGS
jgi:hypothetical protein